MATEIERKIIELGSIAGRRILSEETGFIHFNPHKGEEHLSLSIPVYENALFALVLLKTRKTESIIQAKHLLERLLSYQSENAQQGIGNFPVYLHEYPFCYSRWKGALIIQPLYWCLKTFHPYLGAELREKLTVSLKKLLVYLSKALKEEAADYLMTLRIAAGLLACGRLFGISDLENQGGALLEDLEQMGPQPVWFSKDGIAGGLSSLQMVYDNIEDSSWKRFWKHLNNTWHPELKNYFGPAFNEWQKGNLPEQTLYDFYLASMTNLLPSHLVESDISCLQAALISHNCSPILENPEAEFEGFIGETKWLSLCRGSFGCSMISQERMPDPSHTKGLHPFLLQWRTSNTLCSLSFEGGNYEAFSFENLGDQFTLTFRLPQQKEEQKIESKDLIFYFTPREIAKITVDGHFSTTFKLGEKIVIESEPKVSLIFELKEGKGNFLGHLMPGNRPSQLSISKKGRDNAFDGQIFLRAIRKETACTLQVTVTMHP